MPTPRMPGVPAPAGPPRRCRWGKATSIGHNYLGVLEEIEYHGWLTVECEGGGNRVADLAAGVGFLGQFVGSRT